MRTFLSIFIAALMVSTGAFADKPEWAGKGKPTAEQKETHKKAMQAKEEAEAREEEHKEKVKEQKQEKNKAEKKHKEDDDEKDEKEVKGLEKQKEKKSTQEQKELGKGSETGQEASDTKKKWWKFWE